MLNFDWLIDLPVAVVKYIVLLAFIVPLVFALILPRQYIYLGAQNKKAWRNLKWWVLCLVVIQAVIYFNF